MTATLKYLADLPSYREEKPYTLYGFPEGVAPKSNCEFETRDDVAVHNARGCEEKFTLDRSGFEFHTAPSNCRLAAQVFESSLERESVWRYLKETIEYSQHQLEASKVLCFDWRVYKIENTQPPYEEY